MNFSTVGCFFNMGRGAGRRRMRSRSGHLVWSQGGWRPCEEHWTLARSLHINVHPPQGANTPEGTENGEESVEEVEEVASDQASDDYSPARPLNGQGIRVEPGYREVAGKRATSRAWLEPFRDSEFPRIRVPLAQPTGVSFTHQASCISHCLPKPLIVGCSRLMGPKAALTSWEEGGRVGARP